MRILLRILAGVVAAVVLTLALARVFAGGGRALPDPSTPARLSGSALEVVAELPFPPGNVAVATDGRVFFTLHPDGGPPTKVHELLDGKPSPYPSLAYQSEHAQLPYFQTILALRIDRQNRLWVLDFANFGTGQPRLLAFDLTTDRLVHRHDFPSEVAGLGSMLNDLQVDPTGRYVFIAETSPLVQTPALVVYDTVSERSMRRLHDHESVRSQDYLIEASGRAMRVYGIKALRIAVDSIALDRRGEWLYYGAVTGDTMYRVRAADLVDASLSEAELGRRVERFTAKSLSDGLTMDDEDNIYVSDMEHSAIHTLDRDGRLQTVLRDDRLRWPDGFSFGPDGWLYVTCSALQFVLFAGPGAVEAHAPYQIYRFRPGPTGHPGH